MLTYIFKIVPCHRMPSRSLFFRGKQLPLCARCTGILIGMGFTPAMYLFIKNPLFWGWFVLGVVMQGPMLMDGYTQLWKWRKSTNPLRLSTGLLSGTGLAILAVFFSFGLLWLLEIVL